ncbi:uncharacterized protein LOC132727392 [Ruditapes philippinarum]|uniref:uncharacterized protein LOC132727392 n=1 Tax=Ruditapes philippinarum TaxID=129788 RepID=UPI00295C2D0C|nr:uncharacterized protein LOC132727392 [Ruditapes philippinarum]
MCICNSEYTYDAEGSYAQYQIQLNRAPTNLQDFTAVSDVDTAAECRIRCTSITTRCNLFAFDWNTNKCYIWSSDTSLTFGTNSNVHLYTKYVINPTDDFYTPRYSLKIPTPSSPADSETLATLNDYGLDICGGTEPLYTRCCRVGATCLDNRNLPGGLTCNQELKTLSYPFANQDYDIQFKCSVSRVFRSFTCKQKTDYCASLTPCQHGAACSDMFGGYRCSCTTGYTGKNCQTNINSCATNPCINGGTCVDQIIGYECQCTEFYEGTNCASPKAFCNVNSCSQHGSCTNVPGSGYRCTCNRGYEGTDCEIEIDYCESDPCQHGGTCNGRIGGYTCACINGWQGINCETAVKKCNGGCQGTCYNIFNDYSCKCDANRFGSNCENVRSPCRDYNKCQNGGQCSYDTSMMCRCPTKYTGDGCQTLVDYCGMTNPCKNDAMCSVTNTGYTCTCKDGYEGINCENEVNDCPGETCPNGGTCFDGVNTYYCRCPLRKTGTNCLKDVDVNYDLSFYHPRGYGFAWIPYYIQVTNVNYISVTLWVRYSTSGDTGVYMTQFVGDRFEDADRFMEFEERGVKIYINQPNSDHVLLQYGRAAVVNDGNWHLVALTCDMIKGVASLYLDTIPHDSVTDQGLVMPDISFRHWIVLGCEFDNDERRCTENGKGFRGYISQVNWYTRMLSFEGPGDGSVGDIPTIFINPRYVFGDLNYLLLAWNEYVYENGVGKMTPSEANGQPCNVLNRNPACSSYRATSQHPLVISCPGDKVIYSEDRITTVTWDEPEFSNVVSVTRPSRPPGSSFTWGIYRNTYIGIDGANNKAYCHFTVYVNAGRCDANPDPRGGTQVCNTVDGRRNCMISCNNPNTVTYGIDRAHPDLFTCGPTGFWNADKPFRRFRYPSCGLIKPIPKVQAYIRVNYRILTAACNAAQTNIRVRTFEEFRKMKDLFTGQFCQQADCTDITVLTTCQTINSGKRRKRQTSSLSNFLLEITLPLIDSRVNFDGETISSQEFLTYFILGAGVLNFDTIPNLNFLKENFEIVMTEKCPAGEVLRDGQCIECGPGNYFRYTDNTNTTAICDDCPLGSYQDLSGASSCKQCTTGLTTELNGEFSSSSCKTSCPIGQYFDNNRNNCQLCPIGYYQDEVGQFRCKGCNAGETTKETGATSIQQCSVSCESGSELNNNGGCDLCEIGQYRDADLGRTCVDCGNGFITATKGAKKLADCNIADCSAGSFRDTDTNTCKPCPLNEYQDKIRQTTCLSCGNVANWRTASTGSSLQSQCLYYCASGFEVNVITGNSCDICPVEEYKDNSVDPQGPCVTCPGNKVSPTPGAKSSAECTIYKCQPGYAANAANNGCDNCTFGYYQDEKYSTQCKQCQASYSTRQEASTSSNDCEMYCPSGQEMISGSCRSCKVGFYKNNNDGVFEACKQCDSRYTTADFGSTDKSACNIRTCPAGTKIDDTDTGCDPCPRGTYQPDAYQKDCLPCDSGTSTRMVNSTRKSDCETYCNSGFEKINGQCVGCERGYFKDNNDDVFSPCTLCPAEFITASNQATSETLCVVGNCSAGQYLQGNNVCAPCPKGQYQPTKWQTSCISCGTDKTTETDGASLESECIVECSPGYEDINGVCKECPRGTYKVERAAAKCKPCDTGFTTVGTGATSSNACTLPACPAGQYLDKVSNPTNPVCKPCAYDFYQDEIWQEQCKTCIDNKVTLSTGADEASDCVLDCASGQEYNSDTGRCEFCPRGYYRNKNDRLQPQCQLCPIDKLTANEGGKDISECTVANCTTPGEYRDTASNTCKKCPIGTYNSEKWVTSCKDCPLGNSTREVGATVITDCRSICPLGQYVGPSNACELCPKGTYRSSAATDQCTDCPNGLTTEEEGADSSSKCRISPCFAGSKYVNNQRCVECEEGTYQPNNGSFQCIDCPFSIKYTPTTGAVSEDQCRSPCEAGKQFDPATKICFPCPIGTFQPQAFQFTCLQCPEGRKFTSKTGSTTIESCLSYCSASAANQCSTNATCTVSDTNALGYTCNCFTNYESVGQLNGRECVHKCDRGYCQNGATCVREPRPSCTCSKWYKGDTCATRLKAEELSDDTLDIVIPVSIAVGGLILFLIILAVCCLCWRRRPSTKGPEPQYSEFNGDRYDKGSMHSFAVPYNSRPPSRLMMLQPAHEIVYDNKAYNMTDNHSVIDTSMIDAAVYEA